MKILTTIEGGESVVDNDVYEWAKDIKWRLSKGYVSYRKGKDRIFLHRLICKTPKGWTTDHVNGNTLDNLRSNLRVASSNENIVNSGIRSDNTTGYKGVWYRKDRGTFSAEICRHGVKKRLGCFKTSREAALAYNTAAKELFGKSARLNEIR